MKRTWIHHAIVVNEGRRFAGSVVIEGEKIKKKRNQNMSMMVILFIIWISKVLNGMIVKKIKKKMI